MNSKDTFKNNNKRFLEFLMFKSLEKIEGDTKGKETTEKFYKEFLIPKGVSLVKENKGKIMKKVIDEALAIILIHIFICK